jgi:sporulation protein YlmC with PRC-barrel domain
MAHVGTLRDYRFQGDIDDIRGSNIYGRNDEKLGDIDDIIFNHNSGAIEYLVVDTGGWLSSHKFLVPADRVTATDDDDHYRVDLTKEQIESFPEYNEKLHENDANWDDYENRYQQSWTTTGGILHKEGSQNILTPDANEMPAASGNISADVTPTRIAPTFTDTAPTGDKTRLRPEGTATRAEDTKFPGTAHSSESADWQSPERNLDSQRGSGRQQDVIARDTGRNISNADLTEGQPAGEFSGDQSAYGDLRRTAVPQTGANDPDAYRDLDPDDTADLARPYPVQQGRGERWRAFEENLRKNRVDVTASCRSCSPAKDRAA